MDTIRDQNQDGDSGSATSLLKGKQGTFPGIEEGDGSDRLKSSLRLGYEAQVRVIRGQIGDLERVRESLGLSQRKISQLLLVDPSAWTRWTRPGGEAPPHVWRSLQWYLAMKEKIPGLTPQYFLNGGPQMLSEGNLKKMSLQKQENDQQIAALRQRILELEEVHLRALVLHEEMKRLRRWGAFAAIFVAASFLAFIFVRR